MLINKIKSITPKAWFGIAMAGAVLLMFSIVMLVISTFFTAAQAAEWPFPEPPYAYLGLQQESSRVFCDANGGERLVANTGFGQNLVKTKRVMIDMVYTHHSCAFKPDWNSYDAVGVMVKWYPWTQLN